MLGGKREEVIGMWRIMSLGAVMAVLVTTAGSEVIEGSQVTLPYGELKQLQDEIIETREQLGRIEQHAPASIVISTARYAATVTRSGLDLSVIFHVSAKGNGTASVAVFDERSAIMEASLPPGARLVPSEDGLMLEVQAPGEWDIRFRLSAPAKKNQATFGIPRAGASSMILYLDGASAAARIKPSGGATRRIEGDRTVIEAALLPTEEVSIEWSALGGTSAEVGAPKGRLYLNSLTSVTIDREILHGRTLLKYDIRGGVAREFNVAMTPGVRIVEVTGDALAGWSTSASRDTQLLLMRAATPIAGQTEITVDWESAIGPETAAEIIRPHGIGIEREAGTIGLAAGEGVEIEGAAEDELTFIDPRAVPKELAALSAKPLAYAARYVGAAGRLVASFRRPDPVDVEAARIDNLDGRVVVMSAGRIVTYLHGGITNRSTDHLDVYLPADAIVYGGAVDGVQVRLLRSENGAAVRLPLPRPAAGSEAVSSNFEIAYAMNVSMPSFIGKVEFAPPKFSSDVRIMRWAIHLPDGARKMLGITDFLRRYLDKGDWKDIEGNFPSMPTSSSGILIGFPDELSKPVLELEKRAIGAGEAVPGLSVSFSMQGAGRLIGIALLLFSIGLTVVTIERWTLSPRLKMMITMMIVFTIIFEWLFGFAVRRLIQGFILGLLYAVMRHLSKKQTPTASESAAM